MTMDLHSFDQNSLDLDLIAIERRAHARARRLKLVVSGGKVRLTVPPRSAEHHIQAFLQQARPWLLAQLQQQAQHAAQQQAAQKKQQAQKMLNLPLLQYQIQPFNNAQLKGEPCCWLVQKDGLELAQLPSADLPQWLLKQAKQHLPARLAQLAAQHGFGYDGCQVKLMHTRWGSCSAAKRIHLNAHLLLLPLDQLDYVLLHELCHTRQMNHSAAFWQEVSAVCPDWKTLRGKLKQFSLPAEFLRQT